jgi:hypothetical protein
MKLIMRLWHKVRPFNINKESGPRAVRVAFEEMIVANYDRNIGVSTRGTLPVIAPRWSDLIDDDHE